MKRAIILGGGFGKRLSPATLITNKHLLPLYSEKDGAIPMIFFPIATLKNSGIENILIITSRDHCGHMVQTLGDGQELGVDLSYKIQEMDRKPTGIAQALKLTQSFVKDESFAVILGDNYYEDTFVDQLRDFAKMSKINKEVASIFLKEVKDPERFGVATTDESGNVIEIEEKPLKPKSNKAVTGLYLYTDHVFSLIPSLRVSGRGELEITDINNWYVKNNTMQSYNLEGFWSDMGTPSSMLYTQHFINSIKR